MNLALLVALVVACSCVCGAVVVGPLALDVLLHQVSSSFFGPTEPRCPRARFLGEIGAGFLLGVRLDALRQLALHKGVNGKTIRWFAEYDSSTRALRERHCRMLLADLAVVMQNASPFHPPVAFKDNVADVLRKSGQSMLAASHILRDGRLFQVCA